MSEKPRYIKIIVTVRVTGDFKDKWYLNEMRASFVGSGACGTDYEWELYI